MTPSTLPKGSTTAAVTNPASRGVTGCVFELAGGRITLCDGWNEGPAVDKGSRWSPAEVGPAVAGLLAARRPQKKVWGT